MKDSVLIGFFFCTLDAAKAYKDKHFENRSVLQYFETYMVIIFCSKIFNLLFCCYV